MKILYLTLYRKWFYQILNGKKVIEYREIKPYWNKIFDTKSFHIVCFKNGYNKNAPTLYLGVKKIIKTEKSWEIHLDHSFMISENIPLLMPFEHPKFQHFS